MKQYFTKTMEILNNSISSINFNDFERMVSDCVNVLDRGQKIVASGLGKNVPVCEKFKGSMISMGQHAEFMHTNSAIHGDLGMVEDGDLVVVLTKSGETAESIYLVDLLLQREVNIWLLTFSQDSTLTRMLTNALILQLEHEGDPWNIAPFNSTTLNLIVLQQLAVNIAVQRGCSLAQFKNNHPGGQIGVLLKNVK